MLIQKYQESWATDFNKIKEVIEEKLPNNDIKIEHIGSTSIKNLAAKPIIDIDIVYCKSDSFREIKLGLEKLGYFHNGNQGIIGREVFKREKLKGSHWILDSIKHHLYVCQVNSEELQRHLFFRDYLRENERERKEYEDLKYRIAEKTSQDKKEYANLKEVMAREFVESIIKMHKNKVKYWRG
jgi:GrpB-like predicted nucleotidyltransferase (UPF0157 family)